MRDAFTMRFRPDLAAFVQARAHATNRSVTNFVETLLLREMARFQEADRQLTVLAHADLLSQTEHIVLRDDDESDAEYADRAGMFAALLGHARGV